MEILSIRIKAPATDRLTRELAALTAESLTGAIRLPLPPLHMGNDVPLTKRGTTGVLVSSRAILSPILTRVRGLRCVTSGPAE